MTEITIDQLKTCVEQFCECVSLYLGTEYVTARFQGGVVWEGNVFVFAVAHRSMNYCYAWIESNEQCTEEKILVMPAEYSIRTAADAVQAVINADRKGLWIDDPNQDTLGTA